MSILERWLKLLQLLGGVGARFIPGPIGKDIQIGDDLLQVAQGAIDLHAELTNQTQDQVIAQLHDLPPLP